MLKTPRSFKNEKVLMILLVLLLSVLSVSADNDLGLDPATHLVSITSDNRLSARIASLFIGDSVRFQNDDDQEHTLIRTQGEQGPARITLQAGGFQEVAFPEEATLFDKRIIYTVDNEDSDERIFISVQSLALPDAPRGMTRQVVLIRYNRFSTTYLSVPSNTALLFYNLDQVFHRVAGPLLGQGVVEIAPSTFEPYLFLRDEETLVYTLPDEPGDEQGVRLTLDIQSTSSVLNAVLFFIKVKGTGLVQTITALFNPLKEISRSDVELLHTIKTFDKFYLARNGNKAVIGFTESRDLKANLAKMHVYYKNIDFDICATLLEFRRQHTISEDDLQCIHRNNQYEVTASPVVYDQYWQDFTSKIRLNNPPGP